MSAPPFELDELPALQGRAWIFGDGVSAAEVLPRERGKSAHARGDFVVAGTDFGRDDATPATVRALRAAGVAAVIARSFAGGFLNAAVDIGLPPLIVEETGAIKSGDRLRVDIEGHKVANLSSGDRYVIRNLYGETLDILRAGGRARYEALKARGVTRDSDE